MNKIVWIFGNNTARKKAFIKEASNHNEGLIKQFDWESFKNIVYVPESINYIRSNNNDDQIEDKRVEIIDRVEQLNDFYKNTLILIMGQDSDIKNNFISILKEKLNDVDYQVMCS